MQNQRESIAVVGCGLIGESWSALFTAYGHKVTAWDPSQKALEGFADRVERSRNSVRMLDPAGARNEGELLIASELSEALSSATWVQENAPESVPLKINLYSKIEEFAPDDVVIASSTSSLTWSELSTDMRRKERFITAHPFNPPHLC